MHRVLGLAAWLLSLGFAFPNLATAQDICARPVERFAQIICPDPELLRLYDVLAQAHGFDLQSPRDMDPDEIREDQETWLSLTKQHCDLAGLRPVQPPQRRRLARCAYNQFSARLTTLGARLPTATRTQHLPPSLDRFARVEHGTFELQSVHANINAYRDPNQFPPEFPEFVRLGRGLVSGPDLACAIAEHDVLNLPASRALPLIARGNLDDFTNLDLAQDTQLDVSLLSCQFGTLNPAGAYALSADGQTLILPYLSAYILVLKRS